MPQRAASREPGGFRREPAGFEDRVTGSNYHLPWTILRGAAQTMSCYCCDASEHNSYNGYNSSGAEVGGNTCDCFGGTCRTCKLCQVHCECSPELRDMPDEYILPISELAQCPKCQCVSSRLIGRGLHVKAKELRKCLRCGNQWEFFAVTTK